MHINARPTASNQMLKMSLKRAMFEKLRDLVARNYNECVRVHTQDGVRHEGPCDFSKCRELVLKGAEAIAAAESSGPFFLERDEGMEHFVFHGHNCHFSTYRVRYTSDPLYLRPVMYREFHTPDTTVEYTLRVASGKDGHGQ